jgi:hypothetical protein
MVSQSIPLSDHTLCVMVLVISNITVLLILQVTFTIYSA